MAHTFNSSHTLACTAFSTRSLPKLAAILVPAVRGKSQDWVQQWNLNEAEARELLIALATLIQVCTCVCL